TAAPIDYTPASPEDKIHADVAIAAPRRPGPGAHRVVSARRTVGPVLLAPGRRTHESRSPGVSNCRECLPCAAPRTRQTARRPDIQRDRSAPETGRFHRSLPQERLLVLHPVRTRPGAPHIRATRG